MICLKVSEGISKDHLTDYLSTKKIRYLYKRGGLEETFIQMIKFSITNNGTN